jgi:hypothetical protein
LKKKKGKNQNISKMSWVYQQVAPPGVIHANAQQHRSTGLFGACTKEKAPAT